MEKHQLTSFDYNLIPQEDQEEEEEVQVMTGTLPSTSKQ
jgi:hypothetical protein